MSVIKIENYKRFLDKINYVIKTSETQDVLANCYINEDRLVVVVKNENRYILEFRLEDYYLDENNQKQIYDENYRQSYAISLKRLYDSTKAMNLDNGIEIRFENNLVVSSLNESSKDIIYIPYEFINLNYNIESDYNQYPITTEIKTNNIYNKIFTDQQEITNILVSPSSLIINDVDLKTNFVKYSSLNNPVRVKTKYLMELFSLLNEHDIIILISDNLQFKVIFEADNYLLTCLVKCE